MFIFLTPFRARFTSSRETRNEYCESPCARRTRQSRDWVLTETNMATFTDQTEHVCSKLDLK